MKKLLLLTLLFATLLSTAHAADGQAIEMRSDRTLIFPQRLELASEATLLDVLRMVPDLVQSGFDEMLSDYNVRIDNVAVGIDNRILLQQLKARRVGKIQVCDNTGVAKGTVGMKRVIDITLVRSGEGAHGDAVAGADTDGLAQASAQLFAGSKATDIYASAAYTYKDKDGAIGQKEQLFAHMTNYLSPRDRLLTYVSQQYYDTKDYTRGSKLASNQQKILARARYFHTFNDQGTELLLLASYQHTSVPTVKLLSDGRTVALATKTSTPYALVELNTPLMRGLDMMLGWEGGIDYSTLHLVDGSEQKYTLMNNDAYLQLNYRLGRWLLTLGDRVQFYHYSVGGTAHHDTRNNIEASAVATISSHSQAQLAYHRKYSNPQFSFDDRISEEEWLLRKGSLKAAYIDDIKLAYTYARPNLTLSAASYLLNMDGADNTWKLHAGAYYKAGIFALTAGANYYNVKGSGNDMATFHLDPHLSLPWQMQLGAQAIIATGTASLAHADDSYLALQLRKTFGRHVALALDWHDITSKHYSALMASAKYLF